MAQHNALGKAGEDAATAYLRTHDYQIRNRNWRKGHLELDIVAVKNNELVVIEVKTRSNTEHTLPHEAVTIQKIRRTVVAADAYLKMHKLDFPVRFDIVNVIGEEGHFKIEHIKEAFYPPVW